MSLNADGALAGTCGATAGDKPVFGAPPMPPKASLNPDGACVGTCGPVKGEGPDFEALKAPKGSLLTGAMTGDGACVADGTRAGTGLKAPNGSVLMADGAACGALGAIWGEGPVWNAANGSVLMVDGAACATWGAV
jgi:hypothetical protein